VQTFELTKKGVSIETEVLFVDSHPCGGVLHLCQGGTDSVCFGGTYIGELIGELFMDLMMILFKYWLGNRSNSC
jgi:hypothetical protein